MKNLLFSISIFLLSFSVSAQKALKSDLPGLSSGFYDLDSLTQGDFFKNVHLISGSSGGILSASYYRELYRKQKKKIKILILMRDLKI